MGKNATFKNTKDGLYLETSGRKSPKKKVSIRLSREQDEALEDLVIRRGYKNKSHALRAGVDKLIEDSQESLTSEKVTIDISKVYLEELDKLLDFVGATSRNEAIKMALRQYIRSENEFFLKETFEYELLRAEYRNRQRQTRPREVQP